MISLKDAADLEKKHDRRLKQKDEKKSQCSNLCQITINEIQDHKIQDQQNGFQKIGDREK
jgi:hypothetical protein